MSNKNRITPAIKGKGHINLTSMLFLMFTLNIPKVINRYLSSTYMPIRALIHCKAYVSNKYIFISL